MPSSVFHSLAPIRPDNPAELSFPPMLITELALGLTSPREVAEEYGLTRDAFAAMIENPVFAAAYMRKREQMLEEGMTLKSKAQLIAEDALGDVRGILKNAENAPSVRLDAFKIIADIAGAGSKNKAADAVAPSMVINFDFSGGGPAVVRSRLQGQLIEHNE